MQKKVWQARGMSHFLSVSDYDPWLDSAEVAAPAEVFDGAKAQQACIRAVVITIGAVLAAVAVVRGCPCGVAAEDEDLVSSRDLAPCHGAMAIEPWFGHGIERCQLEAVVARETRIDIAQGFRLAV